MKLSLITLLISLTTHSGIAQQSDSSKTDKHEIQKATHHKKAKDHPRYSFAS